jgi:hypothetical protein
MTTSKPTLPKIIQTAIEQTVGLKTGENKWETLAEKLGLTEGVLRNKVASDKEDKRHHLSLAEAIAVVKATGNHGLIHAICHEFEGEFLHYPGFEGATDDELLSRYTSMMKELGQFSNDIHLSLADGKITQHEISALRNDFLRLSGALSEIMDRLQNRATRDLEWSMARG